jgi:hypothetical protein
MFFPPLDWEFINGGVEEFNAPIARRGEDLVLVYFGPSKVVERVLGCKPESNRNFRTITESMKSIKENSSPV